MKGLHKKLNIRLLFVIISCMAVLMIVVFLFLRGSAKDEIVNRPIIRIAIPHHEVIHDPNTNYYKLWLEETENVHILFEFIPRQYKDDYLRLLFASERSDIDAVFFPPEDQNNITRDVIAQYGKSGYILPLNPYIDSFGENITRLFESHETYNLRKLMTADDGYIYDIPNMELSKIQNHAQILWINVNWLKTLDLSVPRTTTEFYEVLKAFREQDPNKNGKQDEIPLASCQDDDAFQSYNFIINGFVYNDPYNSRMFINEGEVSFAPVTDAWREALTFCRLLFDEGLFPDINFTFTKSQMIQLINDPWDLVGAFTSRKISDVISQNSPEVLARYIHVPPIEGKRGVRFSTVKAPLPGVGAVILSGCKNPDGVFRLLDRMLSEEASLINRFGERGTDWEYGKVGDISMYGMPATIHAKNQGLNQEHNKHLMGFGPLAIAAKYLDGVTWSGLQYDQEYITARASVSYQRYAPQETIDTIHFEGPKIRNYHRLRQNIENYTSTMVKSFIIGETDILQDSQWQAYREEYHELGLTEYIQAVSRAYHALEWKDLNR